MKGGVMLKGTMFILIMIFTQNSFEHHTSLPLFDLQVSFRGNFPAENDNLSVTLVGKKNLIFINLSKK